ncbi:MAG: 16S rRNA (cytidine(1402)-2'-O)-methyltransferase, partial [Patescibacteria group bacterium]
MDSHASGTLFVVATPIGNLQDITFRAVEVLKSVAVITCEDTRTSKTLLKALGVTTPTVSFHQHSSDFDLQQITDRLSSGQDVALITDAGTPGISDPGGVLVAAARGVDAPVVAVPGPSALTAALSISGVDVSHFLFLGYMPLKGRQKVLGRVAESDEAVAVFESTHRIKKLVQELHATVGERPVILVK